ncbi:MAG: helix-turn-helix domain-containing protein [Clostridia bacterium]|nr:helix-turn-helix domain-containing protein [Clostridia bacterium]
MAKKDFMATFLKEREEQAVSKLDTAQIVFRSARSLKSNAENFYDVSQIDDLVESIREFGVLSPLGISADGVVFSGHRRLAADLRLLEETGDAKYENVPCIEREFADPLDEKLALIDSNSTARILTPYELMEQAKQYDALLVEAKKQGRIYSGRRRDLIAKKMNVSPAKLGRLSAIDKNLHTGWKEIFRDGRISESVAYEISKLEIAAQEEFLRYTEQYENIDYIMLCEVEAFAEECQQSLQEIAPEQTEPATPEPESPVNDQQETPDQGYNMYAPDGKPAIVGLPPRELESNEPVQHDTESNQESEHEKTLDQWRKMAEEQEMNEEESTSDHMENRVMDLRNSLGLSKAEMAEKLGWFQAAYSAVETSDSPASWRLYEIAVCFKVSMDWLVGLSDTKQPKINISKGRERLTHERCAFGSSGYWSPAKKEELINRLAEYENEEYRRR